VDVSAGWITGGHEDAFIGKLEPIVELHFGKFPVYFEGGFSPTFLSRHVFDAKNLGDDVQFTSHVGVDWEITKRFTVGWRIQHMSNGGFAHPNPGINFEMLSVSYGF
jgi:hypothetical protein